MQDKKKKKQGKLVLFTLYIIPLAEVFTNLRLYLEIKYAYETIERRNQNINFFSKKILLMIPQQAFLEKWVKQYWIFFGSI